MYQHSSVHHDGPTIDISFTRTVLGRNSQNVSHRMVHVGVDMVVDTRYGAKEGEHAAIEGLPVCPGWVRAEPERPLRAKLFF